MKANQPERSQVQGVYLRGNVWWIRYRFGGQNVRRPIGPDRLLAERTMEEIRRRISDGRHEIKLRDERRIFEQMIEEYVEAKADKRTVRGDRQALERMRPHFGGLFLHAITRQDVEAYLRKRKTAVSERTGRRLEGASINRDQALLRHFFNIGIERGYLRENPARGIRKCKEAPWRRKFVFSEAELQGLVDHAAPHLRAILAAAIGTGLRRGDILGLRWNQVDFEHNVITLYMQKTGEAIEIPMLSMVRELLWRHHLTAGETPFVFTYRPGERIGSVKTAFAGALRRSGLAGKGYRFHDLRRTFATMLYNRGVHLTKIQRLLGHKSVTTTERYLGVKFEETRQAMAVLETPALKALAAPEMSTIRAQLEEPAIETLAKSVN